MAPHHRPSICISFFLYSDTHQHFHPPCISRKQQPCSHWPSPSLLSCLRASRARSTLQVTFRTNVLTMMPAKTSSTLQRIVSAISACRSHRTTITSTAFARTRTSSSSVTQAVSAPTSKEEISRQLTSFATRTAAVVVVVVVTAVAVLDLAHRTGRITMTSITTMATRPKIAGVTCASRVAACRWWRTFLLRRLCSA